MFSPTDQKPISSSLLEEVQSCRQLTLLEIQLATQNFDESLVIGRGGFGKVYKGTITNGTTPLVAAIKRLESTSDQGAVEFWAEVEMLSKLRHCHLVSLIGYCNEGREMILVYEYMPHGTLEDHLHKGGTPIPWVQRLKICIGAARGLDYLHTGTGIEHGVIHRDVKSSNILLHNTWAAKISDFGLSKIGPTNQPSTYVNTFVKGTFGYLDPDYFSTGRLTRKSDVYAFGVVLFEVLCGKRAVDASLDEEHWGLARWAQDSIKQGRLKQKVDSSIAGRISPKCLKDFGQLADRCLHSHPKQRPTMAEVVVSLQSILALQEKTNGALNPSGMPRFHRNVLKFLFSSNGEKSETVDMGVESQCNEEDVVHSPCLPSVPGEEPSSFSHPEADDSANVVHSRCLPSILGEEPSFSHPEADDSEDDVNSHCLPSILKEPSPFSYPDADDLKEDDNVSDDDDDDDASVAVVNDANEPLPTLEGLVITGDAFPGHEIQASGYSRNGTTHCGFTWVRHLLDGSYGMIEGALRSSYLVIADDVETCLAVEVQPMDDRNRKGKLVKCFANDRQKIICHPDMIHEIQKTFNTGHANFKVYVWKGSSETWEPATLEIKSSSYRIKLNRSNGGVVADEKFTPTTIISLPKGIPSEFSIVSARGVERFLQAIIIQRMSAAQEIQLF